jgi:hypothetical protein
MEAGSPRLGGQESRRATAKQAVEKLGTSAEIGEKHPSGAKAPFISLALSARLKSCPFKTARFSVACKGQADERTGLP